MTPPVRLAIFASGDGSNAEAIARFFAHHPSISAALILSNNSEAGVLRRASALRIPSHVFSRDEFSGTDVLNLLRREGITHIVLAGFLWLVPNHLIQAFPSRIVNIHPSLLPKFGGKGMYGRRVHEAVHEAGETETGITVHEVNQHYDEGKFLFQAACPILPGDTPATIAARVLALEHAHYPAVIEQWVMRHTP